MKRNWAAVTTVCFLSVLLVSCSTNTGSHTEKQGKEIVIGFSMDNLFDERWQKDRDLLEARVKQSGAEVLTLSAERDDSKQIAQIESLIAQKVDVLVIFPHNFEALTAVIEKAHEAGIKIVAYDRLIKNANIDFYVTFDNEKVGELQASEIVKAAPQGNYVYIGGSETDNNAVLFRKGAMKVLEQQAGKIKVVLDQYSKDWSPNEAQIHMETALRTYGNNIQGIVAANDGTAGGAIEALSGKKLDGKIPVSGQDAELEALQRIVEGKQTMTVYKPISKLAEAAADAALALANKQELKANNKISNGKLDVPAQYLEPVAVTKENIASTVIKDGFQKLEDIYKNVPKDQWPAK